MATILTLPTENVVAYLAPCTCRHSTNIEHEPTCHLSTEIEPDPVNNPPGVGWTVIWRAGTPKKEGGEGVTWACSCRAQAQDEGGRRLCPHLRALFAGEFRPAKRWQPSVTEEITDAHMGRYLIRLTPYGEGLLRERWLLNALRPPASEGKPEEAP